ncbi:hypothetical protein CCMA1212_006453 [Trichoderma ghanense]|uniref:Nephrocystin 3-like N-terminal domain-containing protein n=1 Tax=Trichoderma ghanense TaxID=65468 RepID=A0ABY2H262_9HYPO
MSLLQIGSILVQAAITGFVVLSLWLYASRKPSLGLKQRSLDLQGKSSHTRRARQPLEILYPGLSSSAGDKAEFEASRCTIIAVHGLGSDVDWSWTWKDDEKCVNWLKDLDMLPAKVPKSRIIAYNYESKWDADAPKTRLQLCGEELIHSIHSLQRNDPSRPIVLIGHSLGGNVIVNGLLYANSEDTFKYLLKATVGLVFLGTPFRGTKWQPFLESLVKLKAFAGSHNGIPRELGFDEPILLDKLHGFCRLLNKLSIPASCFSELYETDYGRRYGVEGVIKGMKVVPEASACIPGIERHALQTDHLKINKYCGPTDRSFLTVSTTISEMYANAKDIIRRRQAPRDIITDRSHVLEQKPEAEACLRDLFLTDPRDDRIALKRKKGDRAQGTCEWIIGTEEITAWLGSGQKVRSEGQTNNILWLHGHPGTGKSTMAIFLTEELPKTFSETDGKTLAYFFCDSNFDKQRSAVSIVRGLLLQLIQQHPQLLDYLMPRYRERGAKLFDSFDALWEIFMTAAADQSTGHKYCIIDALDECDHESQEVLLRQLQDTFDGNQDTNLRILITSRPYPEIQEYLGQFPNTDLATFSNAKQDLELCIEEKLARLSQRKHYAQKLKDQISALLRHKAEGTFLWVGLACKELENVPSKDALKLLQDMPKGLHSLYQRLLDTALAQSAEPNIIKRILSFVVVALRPLSVDELATSCELHQDETDMETRLQFTREHVASCRLMVKIQDDKILLLHQSVKDYLTGSGSGYYIDTLVANADMACRCVDLLIDDFQHVIDPYDDIVSYAIRSWFIHARNAQSRCEVRERQKEFFKLESRCRDRWLWRIQSTDPEFMPQEPSVLHVAGFWGIPGLVDYVANQHSSQFEQMMSALSSGVTPMDLAIYSGHTETVIRFLQLGATVTQKSATLAVDKRTARKEMLQLLFDLKGTELVISEHTVTYAAAHQAHGDEFIELLLKERGHEIRVTERILDAAVSNSWKHNEIVTMLIGHLDATVAIGDKIVSGIAQRCSGKVMSLLLDHQGDQIRIDESTARAAAKNASHGEEVMALLLKRRGVGITITEEVVVNAARNKHGHKLLALLLKERGHEIVITHDIVKAAASGHGEHSLALLLKERGNEIIINDDIVKAAARYNDENAMALLLNRWGSDIVITEEIIKLAAGENAAHGYEVTNLLLKERGDEFKITEEIVKAAILSCDRKETVLELLLDRRGDRIAITEEILTFAVTNRSDKAVRILLERRGHEITITEELVKLAMKQLRGDKILAVLLEWRSEIAITEGLMMAAVDGIYGMENISVLLEKRGSEITITDEIMEAARKCFRGERVTEIILDWLGEDKAKRFRV